MDEDTKQWIDSAIGKCEEAKRKGVSLMLRRWDDDTLEGVVVTTEQDSKAIEALGRVLDSEYVPQREEE